MSSELKIRVSENCICTFGPMKGKPLEKHVVPKHVKFQYLNTYSVGVFKYVSSKVKAKEAILRGEILVNNNQVNEAFKVSGGDVITLIKGDRKSKGGKNSGRVYKEKMEVVFEDEHMAILNKPGGIPVNGNQLKTLENTLSFNLKSSKEHDALPQMRPLHRLDEPTCGLVLVAKTERAQVVMGKQFQEKTIRKRYKAVVIGKVINSKGEIHSPIDKKPSHTQFELIKSSRAVVYDYLSLVNLYPVTGRTHQLRIHMSELGHPVVGDKYYNRNFDVLEGKGLLLCSDRVWFNHPVSGQEMEVGIEIPNKFRKLMEREEARK